MGRYLSVKRGQAAKATIIHYMPDFSACQAENCAERLNGTAEYFCQHEMLQLLSNKASVILEDKDRRNLYGKA